MPANTDLTEAQVREFFSSLSNWGKWGATDQLGTLNYITPRKRAQAATLVREGRVRDDVVAVGDTAGAG